MGVVSENAVDESGTDGRVAKSLMARLMRVVEAFTLQDRWGIRELASYLAIAPSVSHRLLHDMERLGLLVSAGEGKFSIGPELARLSVLIADQMHVTKIARPVLEDIALRTGETVILAQYSQNRRQFWAVEAVESSHPIRYMSDPLRTWSDLHLGTGGRGILAFLDEDEREAVLRGLPDPVPANPPISKADLESELAHARQRGYVISHGERFVGAIGVSAPIRDGRGKVVGGLIASWPDNRTDTVKEEAVAKIIAESAESLSRSLGYRPTSSTTG
jgi:DNA-binding IclR family transcriptional regulator